MKKNHIGGHHFPHPCKFLREGLPNVTVIRPTTTAEGGATHLVKGLIKSNVFKGQRQEFLDYMTKLAAAADAVTAQAPYPTNNPLADQLKIVARLIKGGLKTKILGSKAKFSLT